MQCKAGIIIAYAYEEGQDLRGFCPSLHDFFSFFFFSFVSVVYVHTS